MSAAPAVVLDGLQVRYGPERPWVLDLDHLTIRAGERVALIGPSGSGKTTLLRVLNGYVLPEHGHMAILGRVIDPKRPRETWPQEERLRVGFVFQDFALVERATVFQNVLWGRLGRVRALPSLLGIFPRADKFAAMRAILEVDLRDQAAQRVDTLSGGQQQRVGIARVLAQEAEVLLADEPVSNLDPVLAEETLALLATLSRAHGATLVMSLHQPALAARYADRVIGLRSGAIVHDGPSGALDEAAVRRIYRPDSSATKAGESAVKEMVDG